jgi:hypothetical protein
MRSPRWWGGEKPKVEHDEVGGCMATVTTSGVELHHYDSGTRWKLDRMTLPAAKRALKRLKENEQKMRPSWLRAEGYKQVVPL